MQIVLRGTQRKPLQRNEWDSIMIIQKVTSYDKTVIEKVTTVHLETFRGFFLTFMGRGFLKQMYRSYCEHESSELLVCCDEEKTILGFLAYSENLSGLYKFMIKRRLIPFAWFAAGAFLKKPTVFMRLLRAFLKPSETKRNEPYVELASIGVDPAAKGQGVGSLLITALKEQVDFSKFAYITLETDAENNEGANAFYVKNGFSLVREYTTREGRKMNEYQYRSDV